MPKSLIVDHAPVLLWMADASASCVFFNQRWLEFRGRTLQEERGDGWIDGVHSDDLRHVQQVYGAGFSLREPFSMEFRLRRADGAYRWIHNQATPRFEAAGTFAGFVGAGFDVTERYEAYRALTRLTDELQAQRLAAGELLARLSHDLRTPLNSIIGSADRLHRGELG